MRNAKNIILIFSLIFVLGFALSARAQFESLLLDDPAGIKDNDIDVILVPEVPGPNQNVKITIESYATDINKAKLTWKINGIESLSGFGKNKFSFTTGGIGSKTEIEVAIIVEEGTRVDKRITIHPSQVDLLWEAVDSYLPAFYKGKALASQESAVRVVALSVSRDGTITPNDKVYNWKKNHTFDQSNSGYGKYSFLIRNSYLDQTDIVNVNASSSSGEGSEGTLNIIYTKPEIKFYEKSPTYGLRLNKLLNEGFSLQNGEMTISAEPFYFSKSKGNIIEKSMNYKWTINGTNITSPEKPNEITVRGSEKSGQAKIDISITNLLTLFQDAKQSINVTLGK